jgi:hypothetical protein
MDKLDITGAKFGDIDWTKRREALKTAFEVVRDKGTNAQTWYQTKLRQKSMGAVGVRVTSIVLGVLSTIWPIVFTAYALLHPSTGGGTDYKAYLPFAAVFVILAGGCVTFDVFFGLSSGWMRYVTTFQDIQAKCEAFELSWPRVLMRVPAKGEVSDEVFLQALEMLAAHLKAVNDAIQAETTTWVTDFKAALNTLGETLKTQRDTAMPYATPANRGAINVSLAGTDALDDDK